MSGDLESRFIDSFRLAARQAGSVALHLRGKVKPESKPGPSAEAEALTAVDLATQDVILHLLHRDLPKVAMDAEEETATLALFPGAEAAGGLPLVVVDPVDGTLNYIRGSSDFAVMAGLLRAGRFTAGLIHFPVSGSTYWAVAGVGCFAETAEGTKRLRVRDDADPRIYFNPRTPGRWRAALAERFGNLELCRCSAVDASAPATGRARASVTAGHADRRRAIGLFLSLEAGATVRLGATLWRGEDPALLPDLAGPSIVAGDAALVEEIAQTLAR